MLETSKLFYLTRSTRFLWKSALVLGLLMLGLGTGISFLNQRPRDPVAQLWNESLRQEPLQEIGWSDAQFEAHRRKMNATVLAVLSGSRPFHEKLEQLQDLFGMVLVSESLKFPSSGEIPQLSADRFQVAELFFEALSGKSGAFELLQLLAEGEAPIPYANYALALLYEQRHPEQTGAAYRREAELFDCAPARERLVWFYLRDHQFGPLAELEQDPAYAPYITAKIRQQVALDKLDWPQLFKTQVPAAYENCDLRMVFLAGLAGLVWVCILLRFNGALSLQSRPVRWSLVALLLGVLSTHVTILFIFLQELQLGFVMPEGLVGQLLYCLSIGVREEGMKLLFFCPLIPFIRRWSDLEILTMAGLVGLGFAVEENINYFENSMGLSALGRFVTANFLHVSLTAIAGLSLARACLDRQRESMVGFLRAPVFAIVVHGLYDAFLVVEVLADFSWLSLTIFVFLGYQYFGWLRYLRQSWKDPVSATSIFTLGLVLVAGLSYALYAWELGAGLAFRGVVSEAIGIGVILGLFYREIPETLHGR